MKIKRIPAPKKGPRPKLPAGLPRPPSTPSKPGKGSGGGGKGGKGGKG